MTWNMNVRTEFRFSALGLSFGANPVFRTFWFVQRLRVSRLCYCPPKAGFHSAGGFQFGRRPNVLLAVGELFVRARSARSQARSACVIARRRRVSVRPKAECFARRRRAHCPGAKRLCYCPPKAGFHSAEGRRFCSP